MWESSSQEKQNTMKNTLTLKKLELADLSNETAILARQLKASDPGPLPVLSQKDPSIDIQHLDLEIAKETKRISALKDSISHIESSRSSLISNIDRLRKFEGDLMSKLIDVKAAMKSMAKCMLLKTKTLK